MTQFHLVTTLMRILYYLTSETIYPLFLEFILGPQLGGSVLDLAKFLNLSGIYIRLVKFWNVWAYCKF